ncbi:RagB/SusD family nutrient uptake outer membrane protein [Flavobacterium sp. ARAG 55.4]|uniref:RagB/SusD family nutrient uptake outer membrane protein n=1 Tax=Flavobacterium sp. ARAG 55.4 TaxID=3451357 RepID=UPI003F47B97D
MLLVAEAETELNNSIPTTNALDLVNSLLTKRYGTFTPAAVPTINFLDFIFAERSRELCYESQLWFDLVRTKRLVDAVKNTSFRGNLKNNGPAAITDKIMFIQFLRLKFLIILLYRK